MGWLLGWGEGERQQQIAEYRRTAGLGQRFRADG
jgi:hypothetical protein